MCVELHSYGIRGSILSPFCLAGFRESTLKVLSLHFSECSSGIYSGILLSINDLPSAIPRPVTCLLYADDFKLYHAISI